MSLFGLHKRGKFFWTEFRVRGQRVYKSTKCTNEEDAEVVAARWYNDLAKESQGVWVDHGYTVKDLWDAWWTATAPPILSEAHRDRVEKDWRLHILPRFQHRVATTITNEDAEQLRRSFLDSPSLRNEHLEEKRLKNLRRRTKDPNATLPPPKPRTIQGSNKLLLHFHLVFSWAVEMKKLKAATWTVKILEFQKSPKDSLDKEQVRKFLELVDRSTSTQARAAIRAMLYLALREDEALGMRWEWFGYELRTFQHGDRKAKDAPRFAVPEDLRTILLALRPENAQGLIFPAGDGEAHWGQFTTKIISRAGKALGLHLTPHTMRHSWATMTARATGNAHLIKNGLGHTSIQMADEYVRLSTRDLGEAGARVFGDLWTGEKPKSHHRIKKFNVRIKIKDVKQQ